MQIQRFEFNQIEENTYVIYDETNEAVTIDCGAFSAQEKARLKQFISDRRLSLKRLLNTHLHLDHAFGNYFIYETYGILPEYNRAEEFMPNIKEQALSLGLDLTDPDPQALRYLDDGVIVAFGRTQLKALLIPGHSPGSLCFYSEKDGCVFTGDVLFEECVGRSDLWGGNHNQLISGIKEKLLTLPDETVVYPGHGPETTIGREKRYNPFLK